MTSIPPMTTTTRDDLRTRLVRWGCAATVDALLGREWRPPVRLLDRGLYWWQPPGSHAMVLQDPQSGALAWACFDDSASFDPADAFDFHFEAGGASPAPPWLDRAELRSLGGGMLGLLAWSEDATWSSAGTWHVSGGRVEREHGDDPYAPSPTDLTAPWLDEHVPPGLAGALADAHTLHRTLTQRAWEHLTFGGEVCWPSTLDEAPEPQQRAEAGRLVDAITAAALDPESIAGDLEQRYLDLLRPWSPAGPDASRAELAATTARALWHTVVADAPLGLGAGEAPVDPTVGAVERWPAPDAVIRSS